MSLIHCPFDTSWLIHIRPLSLVRLHGTPRRIQIASMVLPTYLDKATGIGNDNGANFILFYVDGVQNVRLWILREAGRKDDVL